MSEPTPNAPPARAIDREAVARFREGVLQNGHPAIAVVTGQKNPAGARWQHGQNRAQLIPVRIGEANTGMLTAGYRAIDFDVEDLEKVSELRAVAERMLGTTVVRWRDNSSRITMLYRAAEGAPSKGAIVGSDGCKIEALGAGQQTVIAGIHPSGAAIRWENDRGPHNTPRADLPAVTEGQVMEFLAAAKVIIGSKPQEDSDAASDGGPSKPSNVFQLAGKRPAIFDGRNDLPDMNAAAMAGIHWFDLLPRAEQGQVVDRATKAIPNGDIADWDWWKSMGLAIHAATVEWADQDVAGRDAFHRLSSKNACYDAAATDREWDSIMRSPPTRMTAGTLIHKAKLAGETFDDIRSRAAGATSATPSVPTVVKSPFATTQPDPFDATADWGNPDLIDFQYGGMLARNYVTLLGAAGGTGKSALMMGIAVSCALGRPLLGEPVAGQLRVLSINSEDGRSKLRRGAKAFCQRYKLNPADLDGWLFIAGVDDVARQLPGGLRLITVDPNTKREIINEPALSWLRREVMMRSIDVLMLDPFSRLVRGNENAVDVVDQLIERLTLLANEAGVAILIAQHVRKSGGGISTDGAAALRGSSAVSDGARNAYGMTKPSDAQMVQIGAVTATNVVVLKHLKGNLSRLDEDAYYQVVGVRLPGGDPAYDPPQVERGRWAHAVERFYPQAGGTGITDPMRNAVMVVIAGQTRDKHGVAVPFGLATGTGKGRLARNPIPAASAALQALIPSLTPDRADQLAAEVIKDVIAKGYVSTAPVKLPNYRPDGRVNGSTDAVGLTCHFAATPWHQSPETGTGAPPAVKPAATPADPDRAETPDE